MDAPPGWYPDPSGQGDLRWWDGAVWTDHASRGGTTVVLPPGRPKGTRSPLDGPRLRADRPGRPPAPASGWRLFDEENTVVGDVIRSPAGGWALRDLLGRVLARLVRDGAGLALEDAAGRVGAVVAGDTGDVRLQGPFGIVAVISPPSPGGWTIATGDGIPVATVRLLPHRNGTLYDVAWAGDLDDSVRAFCALAPLLVGGSAL